MNPFKGNSTPVPSNTIELTDLEAADSELSDSDWLSDEVDVREYIQFGLNQLDNRFYNKPDSLYACTLDNRYPGKILKTKNQEVVKIMFTRIKLEKKTYNLL